MARKLFSHEDAGRREAQRVLAEKHRAAMTSLEANAAAATDKGEVDKPILPAFSFETMSVRPMEGSLDALGEELVSLSNTDRDGRLGWGSSASRSDTSTRARG